MRVIKRSRLNEYWTKHRAARDWLEKWYRVVHAARWKDISEVRETFRHADSVKVGSNRIVTVFNVCGNKYRLVTGIHYNTGKVFVLRFMTHAEYSKDTWKESL